MEIGALQAVLTGVFGIRPIFSTFLSEVDKLRYRRCFTNAASNFEFRENRRREDRPISMGVNEVRQECTVKLRVKAVGCTICTLAMRHVREPAQFRSSF